MTVEATFVRSAASAADLPRDGLPEIALVGRSNVGKSSLINALTRQRLARTSGAPGKTRLANIYRVQRGAGRRFYLVDLPGYGYARGDRGELADVVGEYFGADRDGPLAALLLVDARHPGLASDVAAWRWFEAKVFEGKVFEAKIIATKIDKLSRAERQRAMQTNEAVFEHPVLPVSAATGEGLDQLWTLIDRLTSNRSSTPRNSSQAASRMAAADRRPHRRRSSSSRR